MATNEEIRAEAVRALGFNKASRTQLEKTIAMIDEEPPVVVDPPDEEPEDPAPDPPDEPEPGDLITRHTFGAKVEDGWHDRGDGSYSIGEDDVGGSYGQCLYTTSTRAGTGPIQVRRGWPQVDEVTAKVLWRVSPNMDTATGSQQKKIFFLECPTTNPIIVGFRSHTGETNGTIFVALQSTSEPSGGSRLWQGGWKQVEPGRLYRLDTHVKVNSVNADGSSNPDGVLDVWLDGDRIVHADDVRYRGEDSPQKHSGRYFKDDEGISGFRWNPTWPNGGDSPSERMWERIYDIAVYAGAP